MTSAHTQDWSNYWQGRAAQASGEALMGVGIEDNFKLSDFWSTFFKELPKDTHVADFACGAGSALKHAHQAGLTKLTGIDVAPDAISVLKAVIPGVNGCVSRVDATPFKPNSFDVAVSQFGFEYAGDETDALSAIREMIRLLGPNGKFAAVTHIAGGGIAQESAASLVNIETILQSDFTALAGDMFRAAYAVEALPSEAGQKSFFDSLVKMGEAEGQITRWLASPQAQGNEFARFGHYLISSTREMFELRAELDLSSCLSWLSDMEREVHAYKGRMNSMISAALSEETVQKIVTEFSAAGFKVDSPRALYFDPADAPVAWVLKAARLA